MSLLIVGTVAFDEVITPFGESGRIMGGSGTYAGLSASNFAKDIKLVSIIGDDFPKEYMKRFHDRDINTQGILTVKDGKTFFWKGKYHNDMNTRDTLQTDLNVLMEFDPILPDSYKDSDFLMLGNLTPGIQMKVLEQMNTRPKLVVMDTMNFWMDNSLAELKEVLKKVDVLTINDEEARQLSGEYSLLKAARLIRKMGPAYLIIKKGEHGALLFGEDEVFFAPALPLEEVFDPTGAGDCFAGGFIGYLAQTEDISFDNMKRAIIHGSALASFCVEQFGVQRILKLTPKEVQQRLQQFISLVQFEIELD